MKNHYKTFLRTSLLNMIKQNNFVQIVRFKVAKKKPKPAASVLWKIIYFQFVSFNPNKSTHLKDYSEYLPTSKIFFKKGKKSILHCYCAF